MKGRTKAARFNPCLALGLRAQHISLSSRPCVLVYSSQPVLFGKHFATQSPKRDQSKQQQQYTKQKPEEQAKPAPKPQKPVTKEPGKPTESAKAPVVDQKPTPTPEPAPAVSSTVVGRNQAVLIAGATTPGLTLGTYVHSMHQTHLKIPALLLRSYGFNTEVFEAGENRPFGINPSFDCMLILSQCLQDLLY